MNAMSTRGRNYDDQSVKITIWESSKRRVWLSKRVHDAWKLFKSYCIFRNNTDFAAHLLVVEMRQQRCQFSCCVLVFVCETHSSVRIIFREIFQFTVLQLYRMYEPHKFTIILRKKKKPIWALRNRSIRL